MPNNMRKLYVDADACPKAIKDEILVISRSFRIKAFFIASFQHATIVEGAEWIFVDAEPENVDLYIMNHVQSGDIVVTQDYGLASVLLSKRVLVVSPRGKRYDEATIPLLLHGRHLSAKERRAGNKTKGPKKFVNEDRKNFSRELINILSNF